MPDTEEFEPDLEGEEVRVQNERQNERVAIDLGVTMTSESNFYVGFAGNISEGGLFVATHQMIPVGRTIDLQFRLPDGEEPVSLEARVCWQRTAVDYDDGILPGFGVQFVNLDENTRKRLEEFLETREPIFHPE